MTQPKFKLGDKVYIPNVASSVREGLPYVTGLLGTYASVLGVVESAPYLVKVASDDATRLVHEDDLVLKNIPSKFKVGDEVIIAKSDASLTHPCLEWKQDELDKILQNTGEITELGDDGTVAVYLTSRDLHWLHQDDLELFMSDSSFKVGDKVIVESLRFTESDPMLGADYSLVGEVGIVRNVEGSLVEVHLTDANIASGFRFGDLALVPTEEDQVPPIQAGDIVRVRSDRPDSLHWEEAMNKTLGREGLVIEIDDHDCILVQFLQSDLATSWYYTQDDLELVVSATGAAGVEVMPTKSLTSGDMFLDCDDDLVIYLEEHYAFRTDGGTTFLDMDFDEGDIKGMTPIGNYEEHKDLIDIMLSSLKHKVSNA